MQGDGLPTPPRESGVTYCPARSWTLVYFALNFRQEPEHVWNLPGREHMHVHMHMHMHMYMHTCIYAYACACVCVQGRFFRFGLCWGLSSKTWIGSHFLAPTLSNLLSVKDSRNFSTWDLLHPSGARGHPTKIGLSEGQNWLFFWCSPTCPLLLLRLLFLLAAVC